MMPYILHLLTTTAFFMALVVALDLIVGSLGILWLCHSASYAVGAYTFALIALYTSIPLTIAVALAFVVSALCSVPVALIARKLNRDDLVLGSLAFLLVLLEVLKNLRGISGGVDGLAGIPDLVSSLSPDDRLVAWVPIAILNLGFVVIVRHRIRVSPLGRSLNALRGDSRLASGLGVPAKKSVVAAVSVSSGLAGVTGALYASFASFINPSVFSFNVSILLLTMVLIGGPDSKWGPIAGASIMTLLYEGVRWLSFPSAQVGAFQQTFLGIALLVFCLVRPRGVMKGYRFE